MISAAVAQSLWSRGLGTACHVGKRRGPCLQLVRAAPRSLACLLAVHARVRAGPATLSPGGLRGQMLERMWDEGAGGEGGAPASEAAGRPLRAFMDGFVNEEFLPEVYVDFRRPSPFPTPTPALNALLRTIPFVIVLQVRQMAWRLTSRRPPEHEPSQPLQEGEAAASSCFVGCQPVSGHPLSQPGLSQGACIPRGCLQTCAHRQVCKRTTMRDWHRDSSSGQRPSAASFRALAPSAPTERGRRPETSGKRWQMTSIWSNERLTCPGIGAEVDGAKNRG